MPGDHTPTQTTAYVRSVGTTGGLFSNDLISKVEYPIKTGASAGQPDTTSSGSVSYSYDLLGDVLTATDQNGSVHTYSYDILGRMKLDAVTTSGSGVDGSVRALGYTYIALGFPYQQTSCSNMGSHWVGCEFACDSRRNRCRRIRRKELPAPTSCMGVGGLAAVSSELHGQ